MADGKNQDKMLVFNSPLLQQTLAADSPNPVNLINLVIYECVEAGASDVFMEPSKYNFRIRARIDGVLYDIGKVNLQIYDQISARIKILCGLDSSEKRKIQEGQFTIDHKGSVVNLRVEIAQTIHGELIVARIHEMRTIVIKSLSELGFTSEALQTYWNILKQKSGLVMVCGPTGCGKTTTLYSTINKLNEDHKYNVMTIEDPVEFHLDGVNQMQVQSDKNFTFVDGLKTILRLSPDIVLVGEIRDKETAEIAVESGLTGQLVLSTVHSKDSVGALFRILDLGIETYLLNSSLVGILAQRLVRKICPNCRIQYEPSNEEKDFFQENLGRIPQYLIKGKGCDTCKYLTYHGRTGIYEVLELNSFVRDLVRRKVSEDELRKNLLSKGFKTLLQDGLLKCEQGLTTVSEVLRTSFKYY